MRRSLLSRAPYRLWLNSENGAYPVDPRCVRNVDFGIGPNRNQSNRVASRSKLFVLIILFRLFDSFEAVLVLLDHRFGHQISDKIVPLTELLLPFLYRVPVLAGYIIVAVPFI